MKEPSREADHPRRPDAPEMTSETSHAVEGKKTPGKGRLIAIVGGAVLVLLIAAVVIASMLMKKPTEAAPPVVDSVPDEMPFTPTDTPTTPRVTATPPPETPSVTPVAVPKVGDCVKAVPQKTGGPKYEKATCDAALFQVAKIGHGAVECPQTDSRPYSVTMLRGKGDAAAGYLCLAMRLQQDKCYSFASGNSEVPCGDAAAQVKVTKVLSSGDASQCKPKGIGYPELKAAYCLEDVKKS